MQTITCRMNYFIQRELSGRVMGKTNFIFHGDCLKCMSTMADKSCDVFTDPPYNVKKDYGAYKDNLTDAEYTVWITRVLNEIKRVAVNVVIYVPKKWNLLYWNVLGPEYQEIILPFRPAGAIRYGYSNQFNKLLTNARPEGKPVWNVWENMQQPGLGFFFRENTYGNPGYTSQQITEKAIKLLTTNKLIYDPFMGTGTTAIAALKDKRNYTGSELGLNWIQKAELRIKQHLSQMETSPIE